MAGTLQDFAAEHLEQTSSEMRKVLMLAFLYPPTAAAGCFRTLRFTKYLPDFGWRPLVITARPEFTDYPSDSSLTSQIPANTIVQRTNVWYLEEALFGWFRRLCKIDTRKGTEPSARQTISANISAEIPCRRSLINRLQTVRNRLFFTPDRYIAWSKHAIHAAKRLAAEHQISALYSTGPPHSTHVIAMRLKARTGLPWIADFRDPWAHTPWFSDVYSAQSKSVAEKLERRCVQMADRVVLNTDAMLADFRRRYPDQEPGKFAVIPNGFDPVLLESIQEYRRLPADDRRPQFKICHPGALYGKRDPRPFLHALKSLANGHGNSVVFEQIGHVDSAFGLREFIREQGLERSARIEGTLDHQATLRKMAAADAFLVVQPGTSTQVPGKLYEMIPFNRPILALTGDGATADVVKQYNLGTVSDPNNVDDITESLGLLVGSRGTYETSRDQTLNTFNGRTLTQRLAAVLDSALRSPAETT